MSFEEETPDYDPVIAERFELLDRLPTPPLQADDRNNPVGATAGSVRGGFGWPAYALASAAAVIVVAGLSFAAISGGGGDRAVESIDANEAGTDDGLEDGSGQSAADDGQATGELTVTVTTGSQGSDLSTSADEDGNAPSEGVGTLSDGDSSPSDADGAPPEGDGSQSEGQKTSTTTGQDDDPGQPAEGSGSTQPGDDDDGDRTSTTVTVPKPTMPPVSQGDGSPTTTEGQPDDGSLTTIRGLVTEVFTDCQSRLVLTESNQVESVGPVSCDGGSYVIVDGSRIWTTAGYVSADAYFDKHPDNLRPGQSAIAVARAHDNGMLTLDCGQCSIRRG